MTFTQISKGNDIFIYKGTVPLEEPITVVEKGATSIVFVSEGQYQLSEGLAAIDEIGGGTHGAVITILGVGGTSPTVASTPAKILLRGGKVFTATEGSQITLRAFDAGDGGIMWIEQSRYVAA